MRQAAKTDANHQAITEYLRSIGCKVQSLASVGCGCPDILFLFDGRWYVAEIKDGDKAPSARVLTPAQKKWHSFFGKENIFLWESVDDAKAGVESMVESLSRLV